ncbi:hypothetical protein RND81_12G052400 [Saponaria officinalis]|uniref:Uncharacterized protein n=1 Tax=Saponaria officinalis TaxID=3572 RepID=A0AAW1H771_SAPOF
MEENGEFIPTRNEDVLVKATGKPEHCGRTRGVGSRVGIQTYFGKPSSGRRSHGKFYTENELMIFKEEVKKETMTQMNDMVDQKVLEIYKKLKMNFPEELEKPTNLDQSSCHSIEHNDHFHELQSPVHCRLAVLEVESTIIVAEGTTWP